MRIVGGVVGLVVLAWGVVWGWTEVILARNYSATTEAVRAATSPQQIAAGKRLASVFGCPDCHGPGLQGKLFVDELNVARVHGARELGLMSAVARSRFSQLTDDEVDDLHAYLRARVEAAGKRTGATF